MKDWFRLSHMSAGFTTVLVGYTSSVAIVIQAATTAGASPAQIESWLFILGIAMGLSTILLSWMHKSPVVTAWSTPGAAMLITVVGQYDIATNIGAFLLTGLLSFLTGLIKPVSAALRKVPPQLATAMLAAILLPFCLGSFETINTAPYIFALMFGVFLITKRLMPTYTMLSLLVTGVAITLFLNSAATETFELALAQPTFVTPVFDLSAILNVTIPLYLVTMLSQNLPGLAVMQSYKYEAPVKPLFTVTGGTTVLTAPFGGFAINLAAITAAICMTEEVDQDKSQRYRAAIWAGVFYIVAGLFATSVVAIFLSFPPEVTKLLAGLALLATLVMCLQSSFADSKYREPALFTFLIALSGVTLMGINSILLGLLVGLFYLKIVK